MCEHWRVTRGLLQPKKGAKAVGMKLKRFPESGDGSLPVLVDKSKRVLLKEPEVTEGTKKEVMSFFLF